MDSWANQTQAPDPSPCLVLPPICVFVYAMCHLECSPFAIEILCKPHYCNVFILQDSLLLSRKKKKKKRGGGIHERCWQRRPVKKAGTSPWFSVPSNPNSHVPCGRRGASNSFPRAGLFFLIFKRWIISNDQNWLHGVKWILIIWGNLGGHKLCHLYHLGLVLGATHDVSGPPNFLYVHLWLWQRRQIKSKLFYKTANMHFLEGDNVYKMDFFFLP